ncbi:MAG: 1-deoxy-D-xylulose-5-phosphate reductoisomerase [Kangiellaceae bacterium]
MSNSSQNDQKQKVCVLGSSGSIGVSALEVIKANHQDYSVSVLTAHTNIERLYQQCMQFNPEFAVMACESSGKKLKAKLASVNSRTNVLFGRQAIIDAPKLANSQIVIAAIVGANGLEPTLTAVKLGLKVLLANKEALVMSGNLFMQAVKDYGATLLPVDSEHNAIFQSLPKAGTNAEVNLAGVDKILLTGSGGPFLKTPIDELTTKTPEQACAHPNWDMGQKISVDSATMMNKGLEFIEACYLFNIGVDDIEIILHPQSIIHSMVSYIDGSVISQMGNPDMKTPIAHCLAWPNRIQANVEPLDFFSIAKLEFSPPDLKRYPCLALAKEAFKVGKSAPCVLNAANEVAVASFLDHKIKFTDIAKVIGLVLERAIYVVMDSIEAVLAEDKKARELTLSIIYELQGGN